MGNSDDILLYFDIRHYDMNMPYTCLMSHISIADQWLLSNTKWKGFRIQCILMKDIMWSLPANVLKTFWNTSLHFNISFCHAALFFLRHHWGGRDSSSITKSQYTSSTILLCSIAVTVLETYLTQKLCSSSPTNVYTFTAVIHFRSPFVWHLLTEEESTCDFLMRTALGSRTSTAHCGCCKICLNTLLESSCWTPSMKNTLQDCQRDQSEEGLEPTIASNVIAKVDVTKTGFEAPLPSLLPVI